MYVYELWHWEAEQAVEETVTVKAAGGSNTKDETTKKLWSEKRKPTAKKLKSLNRVDKNNTE